MKKLATLFLACTFTIGAFAQSEPFVKSLKDLKFGSTILDAAMMFTKDYPEFQSMTKTPVFITTMQDPVDAEKTLKVEAAYFVNEKEQSLVQLYYVNGSLYEKAVYWFFHKDSVDAVEKKYMKTTNSYIASPVLLNMEGGNVKHTEESYDLGKKTHFPIKKQGPEIMEGESGYEAIYSSETGIRGYWVHMMGLNTFDSDLTTKVEFPKVESPKGVFSELRQVLLKDNE